MSVAGLLEIIVFISKVLTMSHYAAVTSLHTPASLTVKTLEFSRSYLCEQAEEDRVRELSGCCGLKAHYQRTHLAVNLILLAAPFLKIKDKMASQRPACLSVKVSFVSL